MVQRFQIGKTNKEPELQKKEMGIVRIVYGHGSIILPASQHRSTF